MRFSPALSASLSKTIVKVAPVTHVDVTSFTTVKHFDLPLPKLGPSEAVYEGDANNTYLETITWNSSDSFDFRDVIDGNGGQDYIATGGGADQITVGDNAGTWRGTGNEITKGATVVDAGSGNDLVIVNAQHGAFSIKTGEGSDTVVVRGGDYVKIDAYDGDAQRDEFTFAASFGGRAEINGADAAWHDHVTLEGSVWHELVNGNNGTLAFYNDATGGMVTVNGSQTDNIGTHPSWDL